VFLQRPRRQLQQHQACRQRRVLHLVISCFSFNSFSLLYCTVANWPVTCAPRYDEPHMLKDIERRLGQTIAHLPPDMKLTGGLEKLVFGAHKDASSAPANSEHFRRLRPVMEELVHLETSAQVNPSIRDVVCRLLLTQLQHCFWNLKMQLGAR